MCLVEEGHSNQVLQGSSSNPGGISPTEASEGVPRPTKSCGMCMALQTTYHVNVQIFGSVSFISQDRMEV